MTSFWIGLLSLVNKILPFVPALIAYFMGKKATRDEIEQANIEKQRRYAEIEAKPRSDEDLIKSIEDGKF